MSKPKNNYEGFTIARRIWFFWAHVVSKFVKKHKWEDAFGVFLTCLICTVMSVVAWAATTFQVRVWQFLPFLWPIGVVLIQSYYRHVWNFLGNAGICRLFFEMQEMESGGDPKVITGCLGDITISKTKTDSQMRIWEINTTNPGYVRELLHFYAAYTDNWWWKKYQPKRLFGNKITVTPRS